MHDVLGNRTVGLGLAALALIAAAAVTAANFAAPAPGADLEPVAGAEAIIDLVQGSETILWIALDGAVRSHSVIGWPTGDGTHDLGGSLVVERPTNGTAGVIDVAEKPMSVSFSVDR